MLKINIYLKRCIITVKFNDNSNKFEDDTRRDLIFNSGGRPANNRDFESLQKSIQDALQIYNQFYNISADSNNWLVNGFDIVEETRVGQPGVAWLNGNMYYVEYRNPLKLNMDANTPVYIAALPDIQENRQYADGVSKPAFNIFNGAWLNAAEVAELELSSIEYLVFNDEDDVIKAFLKNSAYVSNLEVLDASGSEYYTNVAGQIHIDGVNGIEVYKKKYGGVEISLDSKTLGDMIDSVGVYQHPNSKTQLQDKIITTSGSNIISNITIDVDTRNEGHIDDLKIETRKLSATDLSIGTSNKLIKSDSAGKLTASDLDDKHLVPVRGIVMYSGLASKFDSIGVGLDEWEGWHLCNGGKGTPSMYSNFIIDYLAGTNGGDDAVYYTMVYAMKM